MAACTPTLVIRNETTFGVRVVVSAGDKTEAFSPSPGESSSFNFGGGRYSVVATLDADWNNYMRQTRDGLNALLTDFTNHNVALTADQVDQVIAKIHDLDSHLDDLAHTPPDARGACSGSLQSSGEGDNASAVVQISQGTDNALYANCP